MKNITIITTFRDALEAYSLNRIVINQLKMFIKAGYKIKVVVAKGFKPEGLYAHEQVECVEIPDVPVSNQMGIDKTFDEDVESLRNAFKDILADCDTAITHDIIYQPAAIKHNVALRTLILDDTSIKTKFLHWIHSATQPAKLSSIRGGTEKYLKSFEIPFPRSFYITFNEYSVPRVAKWFNVEESMVKYVPHPHDFFEYKEEITERISEAYNILSKDVICMYPVRLDRGKQPHFVVEIMAQVKKTGKSVACIIADFHSTGGDKVVYREEMKEAGIQLGLSENDLIFLSEFEPSEGEKYRAELPHKVIQELFELTNVFILPSKSETYSLIAQEAIVKRNFVILNQDFPPFRSIYGDAPLYRKFSSAMDALTADDGETNTEYSDRQGYLHDIACYINYALTQTRVLALNDKIRKERNLMTVFKNNIEPLIYANPGKFNY